MDDATRIDAMGARWNRAVVETKEWAKSLPLERPSGTAFHRALDAWKAKEFIHYPTVEPTEAAAYHDGIMSRRYQLFLVEHDWAAAFTRQQERRRTGPGRNRQGPTAVGRDKRPDASVEDRLRLHFMPQN